MGLYQRQPGGTWYMDFTLQGVRVHKATGTKSKREANMIMQKERSDILAKLLDPEYQQEIQLKKSSSPPPTSIPTLQEAFDMVYNDKWAENSSGLETYYRTKKIVKILGNKPITDISTRDIIDLKNKLRNEGLSKATVNRYLTFLKTALNHVSKVVEDIPIQIPSIDKYKEPEGRIRVVTEDEEETVLSYYKRQQDKDMADLIAFLVDTGFRLGEAIKITYADIDFSNNLLYSYADNNKGHVTKAVPMTKRVRKILEYRQTLGPKPFTLTKHQIRHKWDKMKEGIGYTDDKEFVPHCLRHTCASRLVQRGVDLYTVKAWLGHSSIQVTERYAHLNPQNLKNAVNVLN